jgi:hypothetical protein
MKPHEMRRNMKQGERELRAAAGDMAGQLRPRSMLRDAVDLLRKFERDEVFRDYVVERIWRIIGVLLVFFFVSTVCSIDLMFRIATGSTFLMKPLALMIGAIFWLCGLLAQTYVFFIWVEGRAVRQDRDDKGIRREVPTGILAYLKYSRALVGWIGILVCVAFPLLLMARSIPVESLILAALAVLAPFVFKKLDD